MDVRHLALDQLAHQDVRAVAHRLGDAEDLISLRVTPPAATDSLACDRLGEIRQCTARGLQDHAMPLDKSDCVS